jgi:hypothetical protein
MRTNSVRKHRAKVDPEIAERTDFLVWVVAFIRSLKKKGAEVFTIDDFSFCLDKGESMLGGNMVKVWYHPKGPCYKEKSLVIHAWWQFEIEKCEPSVFCPDKEWRDKLVHVMRHTEGRSTQVRRERISPEERRLADEREHQRQLEIQKNRRLHLLE